MTIPNATTVSADDLRQVQRDTLDDTKPLSTVLHCALLLAHANGMTELARWCERELRGYPETRRVPDYRRVPALLHVRGTLNGGQVVDQPLPLDRMVTLPEPYSWEDAWTHPTIFPAAFAVPALEETIAVAGDKTVECSHLKADKVLAAVNQVYGRPGLHFTLVYWPVPAADLRTVLRRIRTELVIRLATAAPGMTVTSTNIVNADRVGNVVQAHTINQVILNVRADDPT